MNENMVVANDDGEVVFKIKRSAIAEALRFDFEMPVPVTDANIEVVVNQITALIDEFPTGVPTEFFDLGIDHHKGIDFYRKVYGLLDGPCCGTAWASEDSSLVYFAVTDEAGGLTVFHVPSAALAQIDRRDQGDLHGLGGAIRDLHVDDVYAESDRVLEFARNSPVAAAFGSGSEPELGYEPCPRPRRDRGRQRRILRRPEMARGPPVRIRAQAARVNRSRAEGKRARPAGHGECRGEGRDGPRR